MPLCQNLKTRRIVGTIRFLSILEKIFFGSELKVQSEAAVDLATNRYSVIPIYRTIMDNPRITSPVQKNTCRWIVGDRKDPQRGSDTADYDIIIDFIDTPQSSHEARICVVFTTLPNGILRLFRQPPVAKLNPLECSQIGKGTLNSTDACTVRAGNWQVDRSYTANQESGIKS